MRLLLLILLGLGQACSLLEPVDVNDAQDSSVAPVENDMKGPEVEDMSSFLKEDMSSTSGPTDMGPDLALDPVDMSTPQDLEQMRQDMLLDDKDMESSGDMTPTDMAPQEMGPPAWMPPGPVYWVSPDGSDDAVGSKEAPWKSLEVATSRLSPLDTLYIREGVYKEQISFYNDSPKGTPGRPIHIRAYPGEDVILEGGRFGIDVYQSEYIHFHGIQISNPTEGWANVGLSKEVTLENVRFRAQSVGREYGGFYVSESQYVTIKGCQFDGWVNEDDGAASLVIAQDSKQTLVEDSRFGDNTIGIQINGADSTVVRGNHFENMVGTNLTITSSGADQAAQTLVERNTFLKATNGYTGGYHVVERGVDSLYRFNLFYGAQNTAIILPQWNEEDRPKGATFVHNTIVGNNTSSLAWRAGGVHVYDDPMMMWKRSGLFFQNNILWSNGLTTSNTPVDFGMDQAGAPLRDLKFKGNTLSLLSAACTQRLAMDQDGDGVCPIFVIGLANRDARWFDMFHTQNFTLNRHLDPMLTNITSAATLDATLQQNSLAVDAALPLTRTLGVGSGRTIAVEDVRFFQDGYVKLLEPDRIVVGSTPATIQSIDRQNNTITLTSSITWTAGAPLFFEYQGKRSDVGAIESY